MSYLASLPVNAALRDVFQAFPSAARPLLDYHEVLLRGTSPLTVAQRELIAAYVSGLNACQFCHGVHAATAQRFGVDESMLAHLLDNLEATPVDEPTKSALRYAQKLTEAPNRLTPNDADAVRAAGWNDEALHDIVSICSLFNLMNRLVSGLGIIADDSYYSTIADRISAEGYAGLVSPPETEPT